MFVVGSGSGSQHKRKSVTTEGQLIPKLNVGDQGGIHTSSTTRRIKGCDLVLLFLKDPTIRIGFHADTDDCQEGQEPGESW